MNSYAALYHVQGGCVIVITRRNHSEKSSKKRLEAWRIFVSPVFLFAASTAGIVPIGTVEAQQSELIYWSKSEFTIPFHVDSDGRQPTSVLLEMSTDEGLSWAPYARDAVRSKQFRFTSQGDGLYLFRIKTVDEGGQTFDPGAPPLRILVDTSSPELSLEVDVDSQGHLRADFRIGDNNPRIDSIRLEYQTELSSGWTAAVFNTKRESSTEVVGSGLLDVPSSARQLVVRLVARDAAGNESEVTKLPQIPRTATAPHGMKLASGRNSPPTGQTSNPASSVTMGGAAAGVRLGASPVATAPLAKAISNEQPYRFQPIPDQTTIAPKTRVNSKIDSVSTNVSNAGPLYLDDPLKELPLKENHSKQPVDLQTLPTEAPMGTTGSIDQRPFYSNSKTFSLDYAVDRNDGLPVTSVELWGTTDRGQLWEQWGTDPDGRSPFDIAVEEEGLFGFRMVLVGANGLATNRPRNGDNADAWIHVDTQVPTARLVSALYGRGSESGSLIIEYTAQDNHFSPSPIKLSYSELPTGPWTTIASGLKNTGRYQWIADPNLPRRVFIQIEAFDEAGNIGVHRLDLPVDIEGLAPRGRIQGFRAIPQ